MSDLHAAEWEMMEAGGRTVQSFGLNRLFGQIYALLYLSPEPACLDMIAERLGVSKASVSIACRQLQSWGAVHRVWQKGDRKDYYAAEQDFRAIIKNGLLPSFNKKLESAKRQIERSAAQLEDHGIPPEKSRFLKEQLREAERLRANISRLLNNPLVRKML
jgi:DNA-binding transcriptional regulator GbsR (MarR family)